MADTVSTPLWQADPTVFHRRLARFNERRLAVGHPTSDWRRDLYDDHQSRQEEGAFIEALREQVAAEAATAPTDSAEFIGWFEGLRATGPGQNDALFDWLAGQASMPQMAWFLEQEAAGEAGFDDLLALTQIKLPVRAKLEMARNFWDEMGRGKQNGMHGLMLSELIASLNLAPRIDTTVWESLALANTLLGLAMNRRYAYQSIGALGVVELTAPDRVAKIAQGLERLGCDARQRIYFELHSAIDRRHSRDWNAEVIAPLVQADPSCARWIAEGALMRLVCGARCFERYRAEFRSLTRATGLSR